MLNHTVWSNGRSNAWSNEWSKWLLTLPMLMPIVFALSILLEAPVNAAEGSSGELPEFQNRESNSDQIIEEVGHDFLSNFVQLTELERNAIDSTVRTNLDSSNTTSIETEAFTSPPQLLLGFPAVPFFS
jgi:hypothetical protein